MDWYGIFPNNLEEKNTLIDRLKGITLINVEHLLSYIQNNTIDKDRVYDFVKKEKEQFIKKSNLLELVDPSDKECQGMKKFGDLIEELKPLLKDAERVKYEVGTDSPKGVLLCGIPGCGKSMEVDSVANELKVPLLKMDIGKLMGRYVGESEHNMDKALKIAEAMSPCVLFIDELDKGFSGAGSN